MVTEFINNKASVLAGDIVIALTGIITTTLIRVKGQFFGFHYDYQKLDFILTHLMRLFTTAFFAILIYRKHILEMKVIGNNSKNNLNNLNNQKTDLKIMSTTNTDNGNNNLQGFFIKALISSLFTLLLSTLRHLSDALTASADPKKEAIGEILTTVENLAGAYANETQALHDSITTNNIDTNTSANLSDLPPAAFSSATPHPQSDTSSPAATENTAGSPAAPADRHLIVSSATGAPDTWDIIKGNPATTVVEGIKGVDNAISTQKQLNGEA